MVVTFAGDCLTFCAICTLCVHGVLPTWIGDELPIKERFFSRMTAFFAFLAYDQFLGDRRKIRLVYM